MTTEAEDAVEAILISDIEKKLHNRRIKSVQEIADLEPFAEEGELCVVWETRQLLQHRASDSSWVELGTLGEPHFVGLKATVEVTPTLVVEDVRVTFEPVGMLTKGGDG